MATGKVLEAFELISARSILGAPSVLVAVIRVAAALTGTVNLLFIILLTLELNILHGVHAKFSALLRYAQPTFPTAAGLLLHLSPMIPRLSDSSITIPLIIMAVNQIIPLQQGVIMNTGVVHRANTVRIFSLMLLVTVFIGIFFGTTDVQGQAAPTTPPEVNVEAILFANVRSGPAIEYDIIGRIEQGTTYRMVGRNSRTPWFLIALPDTLAWVYQDLVKVYGDVRNVPYNAAVIDALPNRGSTPRPNSPQTAQPTQFVGKIPPSVTPGLGSTVTPLVPLVAGAFVTMTLPASTGVTAEAAVSDTNVRYAPNTRALQVGLIQPGTIYMVLRRHQSTRWVEIAYPASPSKRAWVYLEVVRITGDASRLPTTDAQTDFGYPTLTPISP